VDLVDRFTEFLGDTWERAFWRHESAEEGSYASATLKFCSFCFSLSALQMPRVGTHRRLHRHREQNPPSASGRPIPQLEDITAKAGITFKHTADPAKKYIVESMSGGVILLDYDRDGWLRHLFHERANRRNGRQRQQSRGALYHNNSKRNVYRCHGEIRLDLTLLCDGGAVGDYDNDGWPDLYVTCLGGNILTTTTATAPSPT